MIKFYYGPELDVLEDYRIVPAPLISISTQLSYANDIIVGYSYIISINGTISTLNKEYIESLENDSIYQQEPPATGLLTTENNFTIIDESETILYQDDPNSIDRIRNIRPILDGIEKIRKLFSRNGSSLTVTDDQNNNIIRARGGTLKSISFDNSSNQWTATCPYSVEIEFNELEIKGEEQNCYKGLIDDSSITSKLIDINKYKIKTFNENWSFNAEDDIYNFISTNNSNDIYLFDIYNPEISISYSLSATGKNYYIEDKLNPAWIQAKNFVQARLFDRVNDITSILTLSGPSGCVAYSGLNLKTLSELHENITDEGLLAYAESSQNSGITNLNQSNPFKIYNETISCNASESEGKFDVQYNAILKRDCTYGYCAGNVRHTVNKSVNSTLNGNKNSVSISIDGEIEGLCEGGIVQNNGSFSLPRTGSILKQGTTSTKYINADNFLNNLLNDSEDDLSDDFKRDLGITADALELASSSGSCGSIPIKPSAFNISKNFMTGSISYNAEYSSDRSCITEINGETIFRTNITVDEPIPIISEFSIPNGNYIIQDIGTVTAKKISVTAEGKKNRDSCDLNNLNPYLENILSQDLETLFPFLELPSEEDFILTNKTFSYNIIEGSYTVNLAYICAEGCDI